MYSTYVLLYIIIVILIHAELCKYTDTHTRILNIHTLVGGFILKEHLKSPARSATSTTLLRLLQPYSLKLHFN